VKLPAPPKDLQKAAENLAKIKNILQTTWHETL
jgi:hypothetical protein